MATSTGFAGDQTQLAPIAAEFATAIGLAQKGKQAMIEINLIPDVKRELLRAQRARSIVISGAILTSIVAAAVVVVMLVYIYGVQSLRHYTLDQDIKSQSSELSKVEDLSKILTIQNQLTTMKDLNDKKQIDSRIFNVLFQLWYHPNLIV